MLTEETSKDPLLPAGIHDLNATILHYLGIDHQRLAYHFRGLNLRLTGVESQHPVHEILS